ncbi:hypothetical protein EDC01DRAFT_640695 [Geopyxis carbonaria]|nr:hypothetical protein EDC01DRAFT_640695 [Geopyxis carbonaria]
MIYRFASAAHVPSRRQSGQNGNHGPFAVSLPHFLHCIFPVQLIFSDILFLLFCCSAVLISLCWFCFIAVLFE